MSIVTNANILGQACLLLAGATQEACIASPWIMDEQLDRLLTAIPANVALRVVIRVSRPGDLQITRAEALQMLKDRPNTSVRYSEALHAKTIIVDGRCGIVSSANITRAGMSNDGNWEMGVVVDGGQAEEAQHVFQEIWDAAQPLLADCVGFLLNPTTTQRLTFMAVDPALPLETLVRVVVDSGWLLGRVVAHRRWNRNFFADPYSQEAQMLLRSGQAGQALLRPGHELMPLLESDVAEWNFAGVRAFAGGIRFSDILIVDATVVAHVKNNKPCAALVAPPVASEVLRAGREHLAPLLSRGASIEVGELISQKVPVGLDLESIAGQHISIMGMTGSGKSNFAKVLLSALGSRDNWSGDVFVFDPHGEYHIPGFEVLQPPADMRYFGDEESVRQYAGNELRQETKANHGDGKKNQSDIKKAWQDAGDEPWKCPSKVLLALKDLGVPKPHIDGAIKFEAWYREFQAAVASGGRWIVRLKLLDNADLRTELVGRMLADLYDIARSEAIGAPINGILTLDSPGHRKRLIVLEEAHSVVPEKSEATDVSSRKDNSALREAIRIAAEGRKFGVGLVVITQRPAKVSKGILSQCNTQVLFRLRNSGDLAAVAGSVEDASKEMLERLTALQTGECFISGLAVPFPMICRIREAPHA